MYTIFNTIVILLILKRLAIVFSEEFFFKPQNVSELNEYLRTFPKQPDSKKIEMAIDFADYAIIDESLDLSLLQDKVTFLYFTIKITRIKGFVISPLSLPFLQLPEGIRIDGSYLRLLDTTFQFYDSNRNPIGSSCDDFLMSFHKISKAELDASDKQQLSQKFVGLFSSTVSRVAFFQSVNFPTAICSLLL